MNKKSQPWMIFSPEGAGVYYFWNGKFPIISHVDVSEGRNEDWYWNGPFPKPLSKEEIKTLEKIAAGKSTAPFSVPGKDTKYKVVSRGVFK